MPPIPKRLAQRPQWRGLPIPYIALIKPDGQADFRVTDEHKRRSVIGNHWCQLCGEPLGRYIFFTGGTEAAKGNQYFEPAAHLDCLIYAMQVCPFIAGKKEHADLGAVQAEYDSLNMGRVVTQPNAPLGEQCTITVSADETYTTVKNPYWIIKKAQGFGLVRTQGGTWLLVPNRIVKQTEPLHAETMTAADWKRVFKELSE